MSIFRTLIVYHDCVFRSAAMNMAVDETLLELAVAPSIRFYRWNSPAVSFGYFGRFADVAAYGRERDLVRRWTGGGVVFHGKDLTYSMIIPARHPLFAECSASIYEKVHRALSDVLRAIGQIVYCCSHAPVARPIQDAKACEDGPQGRGDNRQLCFANPVRADVLLNGQKIAGAAQRRTRRGLLQQGSIQNVAIGDDFAERFANELATVSHHIGFDRALLARAANLAEQRYATRAWLERH